MNRKCSKESETDNSLRNYKNKHKKEVKVSSDHEKRHEILQTEEWSEHSLAELPLAVKQLCKCLDLKIGDIMAGRKQHSKWLQKDIESDELYKFARSIYNGFHFMVANKKKGKELIILAARRGSIVAEGKCYHEGWGVEKNVSKAIEFYLRAAESGNSCAQNLMGTCYSKGEGHLEKDGKKAIHWYRKAEAQQHCGAQCNVGNCWRDGEGTGGKVDFKRAVEWYVFCCSFMLIPFLLPR